MHVFILFPNPTMKKTIFPVVILLTCLGLSIQAQIRIMDEINYKDGLQNLAINNIFQDRKGFIWISSNWQISHSLQRYDGYEFVSYSQIKGYVNHITEDSRGLLWFGSGAGLYVMDPETGKSVQYGPDPANQNNAVYKMVEDHDGIVWCAAFPGMYRLVPKETDQARLKELILGKGIESAFIIDLFRLNETDTTDNSMTEVYEDSRHRIWAGGSPGLFVFHDAADDFIRIDDDANGESRLPNLTIRKIVEEDPDVYWLYLGGGLERISNISAMFQDEVPDKTYLVYTNVVPSSGISPVSEGLLMDDRHQFWVGSQYNGLVKMRTDQQNAPVFEEVYPEIKDPTGNLFEYVYSLMIDRTGILWVGHESGRIRKIREADQLFTSLEGYLKSDPPLKYSFNKFYEDKEGNLWVANYASGVYKLGPDGAVSHYLLANPAKSQTGNSVISLLEIEDNVLWVGASNGIWRLDMRTGASTKLFDGSVGANIYDFIRIEDNVFMSSMGSGFWVYHMKTGQLGHYTSDQEDSLGLQSNTITSFDRLGNGEIWIGTGNNGLTRLSFNASTGEFKFLPLPEDVNMNRQLIIEESRWINDIYEDGEGVMWFGTGNGLIRLDTGSGETQHWTQKDGLCNDNIVSIEEDNQGNLWLAGADGVSMLDVSTGVVRTFDERDGLPEVRNMRGISYKDSKGLIYFGGFGGFYSIDPAAVQKNDRIPQIVITDFRLSNKPVQADSAKKPVLTKNIAYTQEIELRYNQNDLSFTFAALDYNDPAKNRYAYRLEGYQEEWVETDAGNRIATYTNLNPGEYTFRVRGSNNDGIWNDEGASLHIVIRPPFWKTTLAYIAYGVLCLSLVWGFVALRTHRLKKEKIILEKQVSERTRQIEQQKEELKETNTRLEKHQEELQEVNILLEEQKEELMQQKEELQTTLENLKKTQEQLVESEKMAAVGGLVAGVSHEINTPVGVGITAISNLLDDVQKMASLFEKDEIRREDFKEFLESTHEVSRLVQKNLERTAALVQSLKQLSTDQVTEQKRIFDLKDYLNDILLSLQPKFRGKKIHVAIECDEELKMDSYPGVFAQIFTNLILNSLQHGFHDGKKGNITTTAEMTGDMLVIRYSDDGSGIDPKDMPHIFEPFYTSDQRKGTGLGLNIVYNLVRQKLHGNITCDSEMGKGVLFTIQLPLQ